MLAVQLQRFGQILERDAAFPGKIPEDLAAIHVVEMEIGGNPFCRRCTACPREPTQKYPHGRALRTFPIIGVGGEPIQDICRATDTSYRGAHAS